MDLDFKIHALVEIPFNEWSNLLKLYTAKKTESNGYSLIKNFINWMEKEPNLKVKCFSLDGDWQTDGTFIMIDNLLLGNESNIYFNTLSDNLERLTQALQCLTFAAGERYFLFGYGQRLAAAVNNSIKILDNIQMSTYPTDWFTVSPDIIASYCTEPPSGIELRSLSITDATTINELWSHRGKGTVEYVKLLILYNISVGAYDADNNLIAWCLRIPLGALGLLQVLDTHRHLGLGGLLVRYMSKEINKLGEGVVAPVVPENTPSKKMFEKQGFFKINTVYWTKLKYL